MNVQTGVLRNLIPCDPAAADELVVELRGELRAAIVDIRRLVHDLRPPALDELGLESALHRLAERYGAQGEGLRLLVETSEDLPPLPAAVEVAVYRISQAALTNVVCHARASECVVRLTVDGGVSLEIRDDGIGLPAERTAGVGLVSMRERSAELGGKCVVERVSAGGTRVLVELPLEASGYRHQASGKSREPVAETPRLKTTSIGEDMGTAETRPVAHENTDLKPDA